MGISNPYPDKCGIAFWATRTVIVRGAEIRGTTLFDKDGRMVALEEYAQNKEEKEKDKLREGDESLKKEIETRNRDLLLQSYRAVRLNLEDEGMFPEAGELYIREMDLKRKRKVGNWGYRLLLLGYKCASKYGESWTRPLLGLGILVGLSTVVFIFTGINDGNGDIHYRWIIPSWNSFRNPGCWWPFVCALKSTIPGLGIIGPKPLGPWGTLMAIFTTIMGVILITLMALAIRRRFRR